jgi:competence protein ComEA
MENSNIAGKYLSQVNTWWNQLHYSSLQKRGLAIVAALVVLISALFVARGSSQEVVAAPIPLEIESVVEQTLVIDVAGAVVNPGVYSLPLNARVFEAIKAAGGLKKGADASDVNQARILKDGEQIYIYPTSQSFTSSSGTKKTVRKNGPIMINRASVKEFESLDGIGPVLANRIVAFRKINGPFTAIEDLMKVPGIGSSTFAKFKEKLRV